MKQPDPSQQGLGAASRAFWVFPTGHPAHLGLGLAELATRWARMAYCVLKMPRGQEAELAGDPRHLQERI